MVWIFIHEVSNDIITLQFLIILINRKRKKTLKFQKKDSKFYAISFD